MFLHLGKNVIIPKKDIVAILGINAQTSLITDDFINTAREEDFITNISDPGKEKTYVITGNEIYISPISCNTLKKRVKE